MQKFENLLSLRTGFEWLPERTVDEDIIFNTEGNLFRNKARVYTSFYLIYPSSLEEGTELKITPFAKALGTGKISKRDFYLNRFDSISDNIYRLPDCAGNYLFCLRKNASLPTTSIIPSLTDFNGLKVVYTGIAGTSLRSSDYKEHFTGHAGRSTLRKSLAVLFGYKLIPRDSDPSTGKTKFCEADEKSLTNWMRNNLLLLFIPTKCYDKLEVELIQYFNPPLNLRRCQSFVNMNFRAMLSKMRSVKSSIAVD